MKKLEKQLKQAKEELETVADQVLELEQALNERQQMLQQSASRMAELEDKEGQLEHQVRLKDISQYPICLYSKTCSLYTAKHQCLSEPNKNCIRPFLPARFFAWK